MVLGAFIYTFAAAAQGQAAAGRASVHAAAPTINWVSSPAPHGALAMVNGGGFGSSPSSIKLTDAAGKSTTLKAEGAPSPSGVKFTMPPKPAGALGDFSAYDVSVCSGTVAPRRRVSVVLRALLPLTASL